MLKRLDPKAVFKITCKFDEALDSASEGFAAAYDKYLDTLDLSVLPVKEGQKLDLFHVRALTALETADLFSEFMVFDLESKAMRNKNRGKMMLKVFEIACLGIEGEDGKPKKITVDEIGLAAAVELGGIINLIGSLGLNEKKS